MGAHRRGRRAAQGGGSVGIAEPRVCRVQPDLPAVAARIRLPRPRGHGRHHPDRDHRARPVARTTRRAVGSSPTPSSPKPGGRSCDRSPRWCRRARRRRWSSCAGGRPGATPARSRCCSGRRHRPTWCRLQETPSSTLRSFLPREAPEGVDPAAVDALASREPGLLAWPPSAEWQSVVGALVASEASTIVVAPDSRRVRALVDDLRRCGREVIVIRGNEPDAAPHRELGPRPRWRDRRRGREGRRARARSRPCRDPRPRRGR